VRRRWFLRQQTAVFYTFYEVARSVRFGRAAPFVAAVLIVAAGGLTLLVALDALALAAGGVTMWPISKTPRSIASVAILGGYFVWDRFACPERVALLESIYSRQPRELGYHRRLKVTAFVVVLAGIYLTLARMQGAA
jgi:hypothetical protein